MKDKYQFKLVAASSTPPLGNITNFSDTKVPILDGNYEYAAHVWRNVYFQRNVDTNNGLRSPISLYTCAPIYEIPSLATTQALKLCLRNEEKSAFLSLYFCFNSWRLSI